jgi:hypothetical protein
LIPSRLIKGLFGIQITPPERMDEPPINGVFSKSSARIPRSFA